MNSNGTKPKLMRDDLSMHLNQLYRTAQHTHVLFSFLFQVI